MSAYHGGGDAEAEAGDLEIVQSLSMSFAELRAVVEFNEYNELEDK